MLRILVVSLAVLAIFAHQPKTLRMKVNFHSDSHAAHHDRMLFYSQKPHQYYYTNQPKHTGDLYLGDELSKHSFAIDITTPNTFIVSDSCSKHCFAKGVSGDSHKYTCNKGCSTSKSGYNLKTVKDKKVLEFNHDGPVTVGGKEALVKMSLKKSVSSTDVAIIIGKEFSDKRSIINADGLLGLADAENSLTARLKHDKHIERACFTYFLNKHDSFIIFGNDEKYLYKGDLTDYKFDHSTVNGKWSLKLHSVVDKNDAPIKGITVKGARAYFDSNVEANQLPKAAYDAFLASTKKSLGSGNDCKADKKTGDLVCACSDEKSRSKLPSLKISFDGNSKKVFDLAPKKYSTLADGKVHIKIQQTVGKGNDWVLGRNWLENFYTSFDQDEHVIRLADAHKHTTESIFQGSTIRGCVIGIGIATVLIATTALFVLLKPVKTNKGIQPRGREFHY